MSTTFSIFNRTSEILTINSISESINLDLLIGKMSSISFESWANNDSYDLPVDKIETWNIGIDNKSLRGVILFYFNNSYNVKINSPSNFNDWQLAIKIIKLLIIKAGSLALNIESNIFYKLEDIERFDFLSEISEGYQVIKNLTLQKVIPSFQGFNLNTMIDSEFINKCRNNMTDFLNISTEIQWSAYAANPSYIVQNNKLIAAYYVLSSNLNTHLPKSPISPEDYEIDESKFEWVLVFRDRDSGHVGAMNYQEFIKKNTKLDMVDANNFTICLDKKEMEIILKHKKINSKIIEVFNKNG